MEFAYSALLTQRRQISFNHCLARAHQKAGRKFPFLTPLSTFIICHPCENIKSRYATAFDISPCAPEEHSSESGSEKQRNLSNQLSKKGIQGLSVSSYQAMENSLRTHPTNCLAGKGCKADTGMNNYCIV